MKLAFSAYIFVLGLGIPIMLTPSELLAQSKVSLGWVEKVKIEAIGLLFHAKLDTGAENCSLHAENLTYYRKGGKRWVRFEVANRHGQRKKMERRVYDKVKIKGKSKSTRIRPVVRLGICIDGIFQIAEVNLRDRSSFDFPMLIGRNFLAGNVVVDPAVMYTSEPNCSHEKKK